MILWALLILTSASTSADPYSLTCSQSESLRVKGHFSVTAPPCWWDSWPALTSLRHLQRLPKTGSAPSETSATTLNRQQMMNYKKDVRKRRPLLLTSLTQPFGRVCCRSVWLHILWAVALSPNCYHSVRRVRRNFCSTRKQTAEKPTPPLPTLSDNSTEVRCSFFCLMSYNLPLFYYEFHENLVKSTSISRFLWKSADVNKRRAEHSDSNQQWFKTVWVMFQWSFVCVGGYFRPTSFINLCTLVFTHLKCSCNINPIVATLISRLC